MDVTADLTRALAEWRRLTELEGEAILSNDWHGVADQQSRKAQLQPEIQRAVEFFWAIPSAQAHAFQEVERQSSSAAAELIALERLNADLIAEKRKLHQAESQRLALILRDLEGVRRAYGSSNRPHWQSYS